MLAKMDEVGRGGRGGGPVAGDGRRCGGCSGRGREAVPFRDQARNTAALPRPLDVDADVEAVPELLGAHRRTWTPAAAVSLPLPSLHRRRLAPCRRRHPSPSPPPATTTISSLPVPVPISYAPS
uniref:Uncharacterized protein n=1 Tax=Oryza rufipogon TaxID=4529 RepID=A0A0E0R5C8_ORYRU